MKKYCFLFIMYLFCILSFSQEQLDESLKQVIKDQERRIEVIEKISPSVVCIFGNKVPGGGSGVIYHPSGYVITNFHVVSPFGLKGRGGLNDGKLYELNTLGIDPGGDLAIVQLTGKEKFEYAKFKNHRELMVGDFCMALGNPFLLAEDYSPTVTFGVVSGLKRYQYGQNRTLVYGDCIQIDTSINPGNSGGPLFTDDGFVVGINGRCSFEERGRVNVGLGYAISSLQVIKFIPDLLATKLCMHGTLNAAFSHRKNGVICSKINSDGVAALVGMELGDILIEFDGVKVDSANEFTNLITTYPAGYPVSVKVKRENKILEFFLELEALPYAISDEDTQNKNNPWGEPGKIRDLDVNKREALRLLKECRRLLNRDEKEITKINYQLSIDKGDKREILDIEISSFENIKIEIKNSGIINYNFLKKEGFNGSKALSDLEKQYYYDLLSPTIQWFFLVNKKYDENLVIKLEGSFKAKGRPCYKMKMLYKINDHEVLFTSYLDVVNDHFEFESSLLKNSLCNSDSNSSYGFIFDKKKSLDDDCYFFSEVNLVRNLEEQIVSKYFIESFILND